MSRGGGAPGGSGSPDAAATAATAADSLVLYEDAWFVAANKPAGLLVHADGTGAPTLTDLVRSWLEVRGEHERAAELQAVQRLDVDTTGVVLLSASKRSQAALDALVASHDGIEKRYLAVVRGVPAWERRDLDAPIGRDRHDARRMRAGSGKPALSRVRVLAVAGPRRARLSLVEVKLATGRRHQIRVHLASEGLPIVGDSLYGVPADRRGAHPLMLHAWRECLGHPVTGEPLAITAPVPPAFAKLGPWEPRSQAAREIVSIL